MSAQANKPAGLPSIQRGITLVELLVVMVIISIVTAAALPTLTSGVEQRRVREAARLVSTYIGAARSRAIETGRPAGVVIQRFGGTTGQYSVTLATVEVPPPYTGDYANSTAIVSSYAPGGSGTPLYGCIEGLGLVQRNVVATADQNWLGQIRPGDLIRFGYQGRFYTIYGQVNPGPILSGAVSFGTQYLPLKTQPTAPSGGNPLAGWYIVATDGSGMLPPPSGSNGVPYQIFRQPTKSAVQPLQLPEGTCIDLFSTSEAPGGTTIFEGTSGIGTNTNGMTAGPIANGYMNFPFLGNFPFPDPIITFGPSGNVGLGYVDANAPQYLQSAMYLLIGRRDGVEDINPRATYNGTICVPNDPNNLPNICDTNNFWVAINPRSNQIITTENAGISSGGAVQNPRSFVQAALSIGGR